MAASNKGKKGMCNGSGLAPFFFFLAGILWDTRELTNLDQKPENWPDTVAVPALTFTRLMKRTYEHAIFGLEGYGHHSAAAGYGHHLPRC
jgi:hypothetical protein